MFISAQATSEMFRKVYILARPFGRRKLLLVFAISFIQGVFQVVGVTSIFPFLALAADPSVLRNSNLAPQILEVLKAMDDEKLLFFAGIFAIAMLFISNGINIYAEYVRTKYAHEFGHWLRISLIKKITTRPYTDFLQENSGVLVKKVVADVMGYVTGVLLPLLDSIARIATISLLAATLFFVDPKIAIASGLGLSAFYLVAFRGFHTLRNNIATGLKEAFRGTYTEVQQLFSGIKPIKVSRAEENFIYRFSSHSLKVAKLLAWSSLLANSPRYLIEPMAFGGLLIVVLVYQASGQELVSILPSLGVMAFAGYRLLPALQLLYAQITQLSTQRHSLEEVFDEFLAAENSIGKDDESVDGRFSTPAPLAWAHAITFENLSFTYPGATEAVIENLNLVIGKYKSVGIVGTTGCGKSTLVDLLLGLHIPTEGRILIDQAPLAADNRRAWRGAIGYVPQEIFLIDDTVAANIAFGIPREKVNSKALRKAAESAQILEFIEDLPGSWDTIVGERGIRLSGGQRQRMGIARALYHEPELLILDEATSSLDVTTEAAVMKAINALSGSITMLIIAHRTTTIEQCDEVLDLDALRRLKDASSH